jgi:hypothetical protein
MERPTDTQNGYRAKSKRKSRGREKEGTEVGININPYCEDFNLENKYHLLIMYFHGNYNFYSRKPSHFGLNFREKASRFILHSKVVGSINALRFLAIGLYISFVSWKGLSFLAYEAYKNTHNAVNIARLAYNFTAYDKILYFISVCTNRYRTIKNV